MFAGAICSSNSMIYKMTQVPDIPLFTSVEAGYLIKYKRYREWAKLIERKNINIDSWFGVDYSYQHAPRTVLIQADDSKAWDNGPGNERGIDGYEEEYMDTLVMRLNAGVLQVKLTDQKFEHRYYPTVYGAILCEMENGQPVFSDYTGLKVHLTSQEPAWEADNGAIYEVDGIFNHLLNTDSTQLLYRTYIEKEENLSQFKLLIEKAEQKDLLDKTGITKYTVFAPTNEALAGRNIAGMEKEDALKLFRKCVVAGSRLYTDGFSEGIITLLDGSTRTFSGAWENCKLSTVYSNAGFILDKCNLQGSNGVLHVVDKLIEN